MTIGFLRVGTCDWRRLTALLLPVLLFLLALLCWRFGDEGNEEAFEDWGWDLAFALERFLGSPLAVLLGVSGMMSRRQSV